jgi:hypothetical protein
VASVHVERISRPLVGNRTLRGSGFLSLGLGPLEGHPYWVRDWSINARSRGHSPALRASLFRRRGRACSGRRGQADVTACRGALVTAP